MLTLMLNSGYEPIRLIRWQRAVKLCFLEKADVIEEYDIPIRSAYLEIKQPAVIRLRKHHQFFERVKLTKEHIYARDQFICQYCHKGLKFGDLTLDHVLPQSRGGKYKWSNLVTCCSPCNNEKGALTPEEAKMPLLRQPVAPKWMPSVLVNAIKSKKVPEQWSGWIRWIKK